jgi:hypothetical protein
MTYLIGLAEQTQKLLVAMERKIDMLLKQAEKEQK